MNEFIYQNIHIENSATDWGWAIKNIDDLILTLIAYEPFNMVDSDWLKNMVIEQLVENGGGRYKTIEEFMNQLEKYV